MFLFYVCTKLFQKRGHYLRGDIIQRRTLYNKHSNLSWVFKNRQKLLEFIYLRKKNYLLTIKIHPHVFQKKWKLIPFLVQYSYNDKKDLEN